MKTELKRGLVGISLLLAILLLAISCNKSAAPLTQIQQQRSGDYLVTLLAEGGSVKQHSNKLTLEIRNAATNDFADVSNVQMQATMRMPRASPMFGEVSAAHK